MAKTHWRALADTSQYLGKHHFGPDEKKDVTIEAVEEKVVENHRNHTKEKSRIIYFAEPEIRPLICNKVNGDSIESLLGTPYIEDWPGHKITLWVDPSVVNNFDPKHPGGVRIWPTLPKDEHVICENCGIVIEPHGDYSVNKIVTRSRERWGQSLCWDCSTAKAKSEAE